MPVPVHDPAPPGSAFAALPAVWRACFELAWAAVCAGSLPIGSVVVDAEGRIVARGRNRCAEFVETSPHLAGTPYLTGSPLAHAELNALLELGYRPAGPRPVLYTTTEPCPLCMGAARMAGVGRVVFAARDPWAGCASMAERLPYFAHAGPTAEGPTMALEAPLVALQAAAHVQRGYGEHEFMVVWAEAFPAAMAAGRALERDGVVTALTQRGAAAWEAWEVIVAAVAGA